MKSIAYSEYIASQPILFNRPQSVTMTDYDGSITNTATQYMWQSNAAFGANNYVNQIYSVCVNNTAQSPCSSSNAAALTQYGYNNSGSLTSTSRWLNTSSSWITETTSYTTSGKPSVVTDAKTNPTTYSYDQTGIFPSSITHPATNGVSHVDYYSYDPNTGNMLSHTDWNGTAASDPAHTTNYTYDVVGRLIDAKYPTTASGGPGASHCYVDFGQPSNCSGGSTANTIYSTTLASPDPNNISSTTYDGLGRPIQKQLANGAMIDTQYDLRGLVYSVSNPYFSRADSTYGITQYTYDPLGRVAIKTQPDGNKIQSCYDGLATASQSNCRSNLSSFGRATWVDRSDEVGNSVQMVSDAHGRLRWVIEPAGTQTGYSYNVLGDLIAANQLGSSSETPRARSFSYDSLSRLLWSNNPETGVICYGQGDGTATGCQANGYDANDNLLYKTDARGIITNYSYDGLNRLLTKSYSASNGQTLPATATVQYNYDQSNQWGNTLVNTIGRLSSAITTEPNGSVAATLYNYDAMGRPTFMPGVLPSEYGGGHYLTLAYDLAGNTTGVSYPDGLQVSQTYDGSGSLSTVNVIAEPGVGMLGQPVSVLPEIDYNPDRTPDALAYGNGAFELLSENNRLQLCKQFDFDPPQHQYSTALLYTDYLYSSTSSTACASTPGNNGNIWQIVNVMSEYLGVGNRSQTMTYDSLNRLTSWNTPLMAGQPRTQNYSYDSFGNLSQTGGVNMPDFSPGYDAFNHMTTFNCGSSSDSIAINPQNPGYDLSGNVLCNGATGLFAQAYIYDAESRVSQLEGMSMNNTYSAAATYQYDGDGNRIRKDLPPFNSQAFTEYLWSGGQVMADKDQSGVWTDYVYANGKKIAKVDMADPAIHVHGDDCSTCQSGGVNSSFSSSIIGYQIQQGDMLDIMQNQVNIQGGFEVDTQQGSSTSSSTTDLNGDPLNQSSAASGSWEVRQVDLSSFVGQTISNVATTTTTAPPVGAVWDIYYRDIVIVSVNGDIHPIYTAGMQPSFSQSGAEGEANLSAQVDTTANSVGSPAAVHYYMADQLGTTQIELSTGGWPVWEGQFTPFGAELDTQLTSMRYKFTGKERDSESGLDYFGARYYASSMGRFMSPDWAARAEPVPYAKLDNPQSLNLYQYVGNNPLSRADADGHDFWDKVVNLVHGNGFHDTVPAPTTPVDNRHYVSATKGGLTPAPKKQGATFMVGFGGSGEVGVGKAGAAAAGNINAAISVGDKGVQTGLVDNHVATANAGETVANATPQDGTPSVKGASGGIGLTFAVSNGTSIFDQVGPFQTTQITVGVFQFGISTAGGVTNYFGGLNTGLSSTTMTTETTVGCISGCSH